MNRLLNLYYNCVKNQWIWAITGKGNKKRPVF